MRRLFRKPRTRRERRYRRQLRIRRRMTGTPDRPRLVVFRSVKHIYAQIVDDTNGRTLMAACDISKDIDSSDNGKVGRARATGQLIAKKAQAAGIKTVLFDRAGYPYHGRVKAVAEGARKGGLEF